MKTELTANETTFLNAFLDYNDCGAETPASLLNDNHSCQCMEDLQELFPMLNKKQIGGYLSSLIQKEVVSLEERDDYFHQKFPDLFWVNDEFLQEMDQEFNWEGCSRTENIKFV